MSDLNNGTILPSTTPSLFPTLPPSMAPTSFMPTPMDSNFTENYNDDSNFTGYYNDDVYWNNQAPVGGSDNFYSMEDERNNDNLPFIIFGIIAGIFIVMALVGFASQGFGPQQSGQQQGAPGRVGTQRMATSSPFDPNGINNHHLQAHDMAIATAIDSGYPHRVHPGGGGGYDCSGGGYDNGGGSGGGGWGDSGGGGGGGGDSGGGGGGGGDC